MHLVLCQPDIAWEDTPSTFARVQALLAPCRVPPGALLVLPFLVGYTFYVYRLFGGKMKDGGY